MNETTSKTVIIVVIVICAFSSIFPMASCSRDVGVYGDIMRCVRESKNPDVCVTATQKNIIGMRTKSDEN